MGNKIIEYKLVQDGVDVTLQELVNSLLARGYQLYGNPFFDHNIEACCQAMVKYAPQPSLKDGSYPKVDNVVGIYQKNERELLIEACGLLGGRRGYDQTDMMSKELYAWFDQYRNLIYPPDEKKD